MKSEALMYYCRTPHVAKRIIAAMMTLLVSACSNNPLLLSDTASHTETVVSVNAELDKILEEPAAKQPIKALPDNVMNALMPGMRVGLPETQEDRFDLVVDGLSAAEFFRGLVKGTEYNVVVHPSVSQIITLE